MYKWLVLFLLFLAGSPVCFAQDVLGSKKQVEDLLKQYRPGEPDTVTIERFWEVGKYYLYKPGAYKTDIDSALLYFNKALKLSNGLKQRRLSFQSETRSRIGETYFQVKDYETGKAWFMQNIKIYHDAGDKAREARTWLRMGTKCKTGVYGYPYILPYFNKALSLYRQIYNQQKEAEVLQEMGMYHLYYRQTDSAEVELLQALQISKAVHYNFLSLIYYHLAVVNRYKGNLNKSLAYAMQCMDNARERGDTLQHSIYVNGYALLGQVYQDLGDGEKSIAMYKLSIQKYARNALESEFLDNYLVLNALVLELIKYNRANEAMATARKVITAIPPTYDLEQGAVAEILGNCFNGLKDYNKAEQYFLKMARLYSSSDFYASRANKALGRFYVQRGQYAKARALLSRQFKFVPASAFEFLGVIEDELLFYKIDSAEKKYLPAMAHFRRYKFLNDSVFNIRKSKQIEELQLQYQTNQRENKIKLLTKDAQLLRENAGRANNARNFTYLGVVVLMLFMGLLYYGYRIKQRNNVALNRLLREKDVLLEEKEWFIKEIHHRVKNNLQIVMGLLQQQSGYINNPEALAAIRNSENRLHSIALIHQKLYQTDNLDQISMPEYIDELITYLKDCYDPGNQLYFEKRVDDIELDVAQALPLGLIISEAITNAIKYAYPDEGGIIQVSLLNAEGSKYLLMVKDYGAGLPNDFDAAASNSMGLNLIKGLSKQLGGTFRIENSGGVAVSILFIATPRYDSKSF